MAARLCWFFGFLFLKFECSWPPGALCGGTKVSSFSGFIPSPRPGLQPDSLRGQRTQWGGTQATQTSLGLRACGPAGKTDIEGLCLRVELGRDQGSSAFWSDFRAESLPTMGREKGPAVFPQSMFPPAKVSSI